MDDWAAETETSMAADVEQQVAQASGSYIDPVAMAAAPPLFSQFNSIDATATTLHSLAWWFLVNNPPLSQAVKDSEVEALALALRRLFENIFTSWQDAL